MGSLRRAIGLDQRATDRLDLLFPKLVVEIFGSPFRDEVLLELPKAALGLAHDFLEAMLT